ncbi:hypothetical protein [Desulfonatronospira sp.]|uniref:hypothetical protein n=1 Tax=Desulfonatronospira sp. TaxID=1962951 RepID=UPI0025BC0A3F|nr:hypothetical protein [Desulfonatronospira sp.]
MIYEYAIEPELAVDWGKDRSEYRYFIEQFGIGTPRIMSEFPRFKNWRKQFRQAAATADETNELPRITAIFNLLSERRIQRIGYEYDGNVSWLENAEIENERQEFQAILAETNPRKNIKVLKPESLNNNSLWRVLRQDHCPRQAIDMAQLIKAMLSNCSEVHFIDPHFGPDNIRRRRPLEAFLGIIAVNRFCRPAISKIIVHTSAKVPFHDFKQPCDDQLRQRIPKDFSLAIQRWKERPNGEQLHHRYILTDIGGVKVDPGLDDSKPGRSFEAILLERNLYEKHWNDYVSQPAFDPAEEPFDVVGTKKIRL